MATVQGPKRCPECSALNPASAMLCDCGFNFERGVVTAPNRAAELAERAFLIIAVPIVCGGPLLAAVGLHYASQAAQMPLDDEARRTLKRTRLLAILVFVIWAAGLAVRFLSAQDGLR